MYIHKSISVTQVIFSYYVVFKTLQLYFLNMPEGNIINPNSVDGSDTFHGSWSLRL